MQVLLVNDDGVQAEGLNILRKTLESIATVYVVAPFTERSITGHTLTIHDPLKIDQLDERVWGCSGHPADCTQIGLYHLCKDVKIDVVISGINKGANLGQDIIYSGTAAGAREAACKGVPAISISSALDMTRYKRGDQIFYQTPADYLKEILSMEVYKLIPPYYQVNINVPNTSRDQIKGTRLTEPGFRYYDGEVIVRKTPRGEEYCWLTGTYEGFEPNQDCDCQAIEDQYISISLLNLLQKHSDRHGALETFFRK